MAIFVLVHGHMHGAWCWDKVVPLLEAGGHRVVAIDLPGRGGDKTPHEALTLQHFVDATAAVVQAQDAPVILVGHSAGGTVLSALSERMPERITRLVYAAAILLADGESIFSAFVPEAPQDGAIAVEGANAVMTDRAKLQRRFYNTCSDVDAAWALDRVCPEPIGPMMNPVHVTAERFGRVPRTFIQTLQDNAVFIDQQRAMCAAMPCDVIEMDTDHSPFLCAPQAFAAHLAALARQVGLE
jgi:pimeloyl-ACP methyl ester carboxylesterase